MRQAAAVLLASTLLCLAAPALADADLFRKFNCLACHAVDQKKLGPSLKEMAVRYAGDGSAPAKLAKRIQTGGGGVWGQLPMPPQPQVSDADARKLADYILSVK